MSRLSSPKSNPFRRTLLVRPWFGEGIPPFLISKNRSTGRPLWSRPRLECLEDRTLLSATILGSITNGGVALAGQTVFLDLNHTGQLGTTNAVISSTAPTIQSTTGTSLDSYLSLLTTGFGLGPVAGTPLSVGNLASTFQNLAVNLNLTNNSPDPITVTLDSPLTQQIPNLEVLFTLQPGQTFNGTIDGNAKTPITLANNINNPGSTVTGTYAPVQAFNNPQFGINNSDPNGLWGLVFLNGTGSDYSELNLNSFSLTFSQSEPSTQTDAAGNFSFTGLAAGSYTVGLALPAAYRVIAPTPGVASQTVAVADGQTVAGVNFNVQPAPDLTSVSFALASPSASLGQPITVKYTLTNKGAGDASAFDVGLYLSSTGVITANPALLLGTLHFNGSNGLPNGLAAGASFSGTMTVTLPTVTPAGFGPLSSDYVGFVIDPANTIKHSEANQSNQGAGIDLALLGTPANVAVTTNGGVHQDPSLAVDPTNPHHLVTAYMDNSLTQNRTTSAQAVASGTSIITPAALEPDIVPGAYLLIDKGLADQETIQVTAVTGTTFTATFAVSHPAGFTIDSLLYAGIGVAVSLNGGQTWTTTSVPLPTGYDQGAANPKVAFDGSGNVYVSFQATTYTATLPEVTANLDNTSISYGFHASNGIFVAKSTDGGLTWAQPVAVSANPYTVGGSLVQFDEFPDLAIDTFGSAATNPYYGSIYITWTRFYPPGQFPGDTGSTGGSQLLFAISTDGASSWAIQYQDVPGPGPGTGRVSALEDFVYGVYDGKGSFDKFTTITVGPGGGVFITAYAGGNVVLFSSTNGGRSTVSGSTLNTGFIPPNFADQLGFISTENDYLLTDPTFSSADAFRTLKNRRLIVADPNEPGVLYAVGPNSFSQAAVNGGSAVDANGIFFAVSNDFGETWNSNFTVGSESQSELLAVVPTNLLSVYAPVLNDDNGGFFPGYASSLSSQVVSSHAMPSITVSPNGTIVVIWYDNRSDPSGQNIKVWGTVSTDGGKTFSANFPVSNQSFDPNAGAFISPNGTTSYYLGDQIGVAATNGTAYAVWTDTRDGNQAIYTSSFNLTPLPAAPVDRFAPNNTQALATNLGNVTVQQVIPKLVLAPGNSEEWFSFEAGASGVLSISASLTSASSGFQLTLVDGNGKPIPGATINPVLNASGVATGQVLVAPSVAGTTYWIRVSTQANTSTTYSLTLGALTGDLGTQVEGTTTGTVAQGGQNLYRLETAIAGTLQVNLGSGSTGGGTLNLSILGADGQSVLLSDPAAGVGPGQSEPEPLSIPVTAGQVVFLQVSGANLTSASADFTLQFTNLDQFEGNGLKTLYYPIKGDPTSIATADLGNGKTDILVSNTNATDSLGVLLGNGDGTFTAESAYGVGPGLGSANVTAGNRQFAVASLTGNGIPDVIMPNLSTGDVSVLLGNGDGTFQPHRRFNALSGPGAVTTGVFTSSGNTDAIVVENFAQGANSYFAYLQGNGNGTFQPPVLYPTVFTQGATGIVVGSFGNPDSSKSQSNLDLIIYSKNSQYAQIFYGNGDGTFADGGTFNIGETAYNATVATIGGNLYLISAGTNTGNIYVTACNGNGTFQTPVSYLAMKPQPGDNIGITGLVVTNFGNASPNDPLNIVVTAAARSGQGTAEVILLPGNGDGTFGTVKVLATVGTAGNIAVGDFGNGATDLAVADKGGVTIIYGNPLNLSSNSTPATARNLGDADHLISQPEAIVTGYPTAYFTYTAPTESAPGAGDQIVDISASYQYTTGQGLNLQVKGGTILQSYFNSSSGDRIRVRIPQGGKLTIEVTGADANSFGVYTLDVDVLPQVIVSSIQAESALPGGPATCIVLTLQGDLLDPVTAQNPANYTVIWNSPSGNQVIPIGSVGGAQPVVYDEIANVDIASGLSYPNEARQTITLLFASPLPAGNYTLELSPNIQSASYNTEETPLLVDDAYFGGHPIVTNQSGSGGVTVITPNLVSPSKIPDPSDADSIGSGTPFLSQLQNDLSALLDSLIKENASQATITAAINNQIYSRFLPQFQAGISGAQTFGIIWLDPVSIGLVAPSKQATTGSSGLVTPSGSVNYSAGSSQAINTVDRTYIEVGSNVEVIVLANVVGTFKLDVADVPVQARGGSVVFSSLLTQINSYTDALQSGINQFSLTIPELVAALVSQTTLFNTASTAVSNFGADAELILLSTLITGVSFDSVVTGNTGTTAETVSVVIPNFNLKQQVSYIELEKSSENSEEDSTAPNPILPWIRSIGAFSQGGTIMVNGLATVITTGSQAINKALSQILNQLGNSSLVPKPSSPMPPMAPDAQNEPEIAPDELREFQEINTSDVVFETPMLWEQDACWLGLSLVSGFVLAGFPDLASTNLPDEKRWKRWMK